MNSLKNKKDSKNTFTLFPIGYIEKNNLKTIVRIADTYLPGLKQIEFFSHIKVFVWYNDVETPHTAILKIQGLIESHPVHLYTAALQSVDYKTGMLIIDSIDAPHGCAVLDIKPYIPIIDRIKHVIVPSSMLHLPVWREQSSRNSLSSEYSTDINISEGKKDSHTHGQSYELSAIGSIYKKGKNCTILLQETYRKYLSNLEHFSHLQVVWWFHSLDNDRFRKMLKGDPPYENAPSTGVFASRSPVRPNLFALDTVQVAHIDIEQGIISIDMTEAYDNTPVLQIFPYIPCLDRVSTVQVPPWLAHWPQWRDYRAVTETTDVHNLKPAAIDRLHMKHGSAQTTDRSRTEEATYPEYLNNINSKENKAHDHKRDKEFLSVHGARQHNLKNIDVCVPHNKITVITGVSGSGKSSLAFNTVFAEGHYRYMNCMSARAGQFLANMEKPDVDDICGLNPVIAIKQKTITGNPRSSVGTISGITDYLRVLFAKIGTIHCTACGTAIRPVSAMSLTRTLESLSPGINFSIQSCNKKKKNISTFTVLDKNYKDYSSFHEQLFACITQSFEEAHGLLKIVCDGEDFNVSKYMQCPSCQDIYFELSPGLFSSNSPEGMCSDCNGLGTKIDVDLDRIIVNENLSLLDGASNWHGILRKKEMTANWMTGEVYALAEKYKIDLETPWKKLPQDFRDAVLFGTGKEKLNFQYRNEKRGRTGTITRPAMGAVNNIKRLLQNNTSSRSQEYLAPFLKQMTCPSCHAEKLCPEGRLVTVGTYRFPDVVTMSLTEIWQWIITIPSHLTKEQIALSNELLLRIKTRCSYLLDVGLNYLSLDRPASTLSGGEAQRIRLASQLGSGLRGLLYILDEPSIGLHPRDHSSLLITIKKLCDDGNTVLVVEHDEDTMNAADYIIDLGPGAGIHGGEIIAEGTLQQICNDNNSLTGAYLSKRKSISEKDKPKRRGFHTCIELTGANLHNLKNISVTFPLGTFIGITGVSGSGKSSLITHTLCPAISSILAGQRPDNRHINAILGVENISDFITITQDPIGRTPRSNPSTYVGVFDEIRKVFANTKEAKAQKLKANHFSFNSKGGRCETCTGQGKIKVEMGFMPDVWINCSDCNGKRYTEKLLDIKYQGQSIADIFDMDVEEALEFFHENRKITSILQTLHDVGLDYIKLGQSSTTLSGGEAQRIKLAKQLSLPDTGKTLYVLDEPTTGLHFEDIRKLLEVLNKLVDAGNTIIVIEHNLDVIMAADWVVDLGPDGGDGGGYVIAQGTPFDIAEVTHSHTGQFLRKMMQ